MASPSRGTRVHLAVVVHVLALLARVEPLGMLGGEFFIDLAKVKPADHADACRVKPGFRTCDAGRLFRPPKLTFQQTLQFLQSFGFHVR